MLIKHWNNLLREMVEPLSLGPVKTHLEKELNNLLNN